ncbi:MAG: hypothetical protein MI974_31775 [Chitinophagales bacterium]|nr:hypothetical protein [Chitinophagales bacterium]
MKVLRNMNLNLRDILLASPFEKNNNLDGKLTEDIFFEKLFVKTYQFDEIKRILLKKIDPLDEDKLLIFFNGFSGNGKTTFLKWFIREEQSSNFEHIYIDVASAPRIVEDNEDVIERNPIQVALQNNLFNRARGNEFYLIELFHFILSRKDVLLDFFKPGFYIHLENDIDSARSLTNDTARWVVRRLGFNDTFMLYFIDLLYRRTDHNPDNITMIYFDNLDDLKIEFISNKFPLQFERIKSNLIGITQIDDLFDVDVYFTKQFRFIFCMRDANNAEVNAHIKDVDNPTMDELHFTLLTTGKEILKKRIDFASKVLTGKGKKSALVEVIVKLIQDSHTKKVFLPLFNFDYRKLISFIVKMSENDNEGKKRLNLNRYTEVSHKSLYGARGILYHGFIRGLWESDYLKDFADTPRITYSEGLCNPIRVILSVLLDQSNYKSSIEKNKEFISSENIGLYQLVNILDGIYGDKVIIENIKKYYLCHRESWSHLITIFNKKVSEDSRFENEIKLLLQIKKMKNEGLNTSGPEKKLNRIKVKINPSGFAYLKYLIPHFEFYSRLVGYRVPLFSSTDFDYRERKYKFNKIIDDVKKRVELHLELMHKFYHNKFFKQRSFSSDTFVSSPFSFKYKGRDDMETPSNVGYFHGRRLIDHHISYIDELRVLVLNDERFIKNHESKIASFIGSYGIKEMNKQLVDHIVKYVDMFKYVPSTDSSSEVKSVYEKCIKHIESTGYTDINFRINREYSKRL